MRKGRLDESVAAYAKALRPQPGNPFLQKNLRRAEQERGRLAALLAGLLAGEKEPADAAERLALAGFCSQQGKQLHGLAARLYQEAFAKLSGLADKLDSGHRADAARAAALAGGGRGKDDPPPDDQERARWREQARQWLRADLAAWTKRARGKPEERIQARWALGHWQADPDLAGVRDPDALATLPEAERDEWRRLWADVAALLKQAEAPPKGDSND
jgi:serine/threonine-protein kinase